MREPEPPGPVRPSIPALWWAGCGAWVGACVAEAVTWRSWNEGSWTGVASALVCCVAIIGAATLAGRRAPSVFWLAAIAGAGVCVVGLVAWSCWSRDVARLETGRVHETSAEVVEDVRSGRFGASTEVVLVDRVARRARVRVLLAEDAEPPELGEAVALSGTFLAPPDDDRGRRMHRAAIVGTIRAFELSRRGWAGSLPGAIGPFRARAARLVDGVPGPGGALLAGVTLGDRRRLRESETESAFRTAGLSHLIAVSGSHLVVVAACAAWLLARLRVRPATRIVVLAVLLGLYVVLTGVQPSAVRAWTMSTLVGLAVTADRRADAGAALGATVVGVLLLSPASAFDLGFQLSVAAVAGLVMLGRLAEWWLATALGPARALAGPFGLAVVAQAATLPMTVPLFGMVSLVGPVANALCGPLVAMSLPVGLAGVVLGLAAPRPAGGILRAAGTGLAGSDAIAQALAAIPHAAVPLGVSAVAAAITVAGLLIAAWAAWPRPEKRGARATIAVCCALVVASALTPPSFAGPELVMLDVGQGDAVLLRDGTRSVLVDGGPDAVELRQALARMRVRSLDAVVVTHLHDDHTAGLEGLEGTVPVGRLLVTPEAERGMGDCEIVEWLGGPRVEVVSVSSGARAGCGAIALRVLSPGAGRGDPGTNEQSVVLLAEAPGWTALLTGDAEADVLSRVVGDGAVGDVDVLKVGHHGSEDAVSSSTLGVLRPEVALVSVGAGNRFGHPAASTLETLARAGTTVFRTDRDGDVRLRVSRGALVRVP